MRHFPHGLLRGRVVGQARDDMPVNMRELVAEEFIVDLVGVVDVGKGLGHSIYFFDQLRSFVRRELKQFRGMALQDNDRPPGEKLVLMEIGFGESKVLDEMVLSWPCS